MRSGQPFSMRYPLVEVEGSYGTLSAAGNWAQPRYTASRLSHLSDYILKETDPHSVKEWVYNYDDTELMPRVLSSLGFYNIVNGSTGIAVGISSGIPQFNLVETNNALITLLKDPDAPFADILCYPDFATGGTIINKQEVARALEMGEGSCVIRAKIDYDKKDHALVVRELPYGVYTDKICSKIEQLVAKDERFGIVNINDLTGEKVCMKLYLDKGVDPEVMKEKLYQKTSLQSTFKINMTMLEEGRFPKRFNWREALLQHLEHEKSVYTNMYRHQLEQRENRLEIVEGLLLAIGKIKETVDVIMSASSTSAANKNLQKLLGVNENQAKAILEIKLSRLAKMETKKYKDEKKQLEKEIADLKAILSSEDKLKEKMIIRFQEVSKEFGDARRTIVDDVVVKKYVENPKAARDIVVVWKNGRYVKKVAAEDFKKQVGEQVCYQGKDDTMLYLFSSLGKVYRYKTSYLKYLTNADKGQALASFLELSENEEIVGISDLPQDFIDNNSFIMVSSNNKVKSLNLETIIGNIQKPNGLACYPDPDTLLLAALVKNNSYVEVFTDTCKLQMSVDDLTRQGRAAVGNKAINQTAPLVAADTSARKSSTYFGKRASTGKFYKES